MGANRKKRTQKSTRQAVRWWNGCWEIPFLTSDENVFNFFLGKPPPANSSFLVEINPSLVTRGPRVNIPACVCARVSRNKMRRVIVESFISSSSMHLVWLFYLFYIFIESLESNPGQISWRWVSSETNGEWFFFYCCCCWCVSSISNNWIIVTVVLEFVVSNIKFSDAGELY